MVTTTSQQRSVDARFYLPPLVRIRQPGLPIQAPGRAEFSRLMDSFEPISLAQMDAVALLDRTDTKYVMHTSLLYTALAALNTDYWVLAIDDARVHPYQTLYFDTSDFAMYMRHHAGRQVRYKVRSRRYVESHRSFLEVKVKTNKDRTSKRRIETGELVTTFTPEAYNFVGAFVPLDALAKVSEGDDLLTFAPQKVFQSIAFSSPALEQGATLEVSYGGSSTGTAFGGLYQDGTYTPGEEIAGFSISNVVTRIGNSTR